MHCLKHLFIFLKRDLNRFQQKNTDMYILPVLNKYLYVYKGVCVLSDFWQDVQKLPFEDILSSEGLFMGADP